ncbi:MAG: M15 family metallopeptidase [Parvularculaceae bacterium]|nr:M15 family metallopeptidase [Parvularculaceae bacterium]
MSKLDGLHPIVRQKAEALIAICAAAKLPIIVTQGLRTDEEQAALWAKGRTAPGPKVTNAKPGHSYHNYGLAFDIAVVKNGRPTWDDKVSVDGDETPDYVEVGEIGEQLGLEWGGRWKFRDLPHFQMRFGLSLADLKSGKRPTIEGDVVQLPVRPVSVA